MNDLIFEPENLTVETIKQYLCPKATNQELMIGLQIAKTFKLNPLKREIYFIKYTDKQPMQVVTGYEVYLKRADRTGKYAGLETTTEGSIANGDLKAIVKIYRKDWERPLIHEAEYNEYVQMKKDFETGKTEPNSFWKNKPKTMIKKVAESQGFRKAFPDEMAGMPYTSDEVIDQEKALDITAESIPSEQKALSFESNKESNINLSSDELFLTEDQLKALNVIAKKNDYSLKEIKEFIQYTFELTKIKDLKNKHLPALQKYLSKPKDKINVSAELMEASVEVENS